jgi:DNA helicase II / ATP-dependent DNA helicase PcrA
MKNEWTDNQQEAIDTIEQNMRIVACAGSGKTTTMVEHILHLLNQADVEPENIVAITYTEKAAASLKQKIFEAYEKQHSSLEGLANMYIGTIHGFCLYMLQEFSDEYKTFETLNDVQTKLFIKRYRRDNGIYDVMYHSVTGSSTYPLYRDKSSADKKANAINAYKAFLDIGREYGIKKLDKSLQNHIEKYEKTLVTHKYFDFTTIINILFRKFDIFESGRIVSNVRI